MGSKALVIPLGIEREGCKVALAAIFVSIAYFGGAVAAVPSLFPAGFK
jgi:hypothetical protein